jgi:hypothetical protein
MSMRNEIISLCDEGLQALEVRDTLRLRLVDLRARVILATPGELSALGGEAFKMWVMVGGAMTETQKGSPL